MLHRPRRLRHRPALRQLVAETQLHPADFIAPLFAVEGKQEMQAIPSMPGYYRYSLDLLAGEVKDLYQKGCRAVLLFVKVAPTLKDNAGTEAWNKQGLMQRAIHSIKEAAPEMHLMTDVALDPYSIYGHDGIVQNGQVDNDATLEALGQMGLSHAEAGADMLAPSDMMDGRVASLRHALDAHHFTHTGIMSYTSKYASCFYGPFRDALASAPVAQKNVPTDKKTYQMDPANSREARRETALDEAEGADMLMVKPAGAYLDIIAQTRAQTQLPVAAYQVSGEYAMIKAAAEKGWLEEEAALQESLLAIRRAGADLIATYFVHDILRLLQA
ncbi:MAG: porphobilinogen synthase [Schleiferiaceae bacterium]|nr:porphobilinogen synthase [Schleiferiaceae bacterium]